VNKKLRIIPKRRPTDVERLAEALLDLAASLDDNERQRLAAEDTKLRKQLGGGRRTQKGSAA
jgi:hypothetical protein